MRSWKGLATLLRAASESLFGVTSHIEVEPDTVSGMGKVGLGSIARAISEMHFYKVGYMSDGFGDALNKRLQIRCIWYSILPLGVVRGGVVNIL